MLGGVRWDRKHTLESSQSALFQLPFVTAHVSRPCVLDAGAISKQDLRRFLKWAAVHLGYPALGEVEAAPPSAELEPLREGAAVQTDEADMGMTYEELSIYGRLRKLQRCGPVSMFRQLMVLWRDKCVPGLICVSANGCERVSQRLGDLICSGRWCQLYIEIESLAEGECVIGLNDLCI